MKNLINEIFEKATIRDLAHATYQAAKEIGNINYLQQNNGMFQCPYCNCYYNGRKKWGEDNKELVVIQLIKLYLKDKK